MTNLRSLSDLFRAAGKLAAACVFATAIATAAYAQPNTLPPSGSVGVGTATPWQRLSVLGAAGNREGVSIAGEGNTWVYTDLNLTPISSGIATGKPTNFAWSVRKDAYYGGDSSGPSLVMEVSRQGGGVYVPFVINPSGNLLLQSASNATNGNVGIGTVAPAYKLQVGSNIWSNLGANYKLAVDGDLALGSAVPGSNSGLSMFEGTNGYRFNLFKRAGYTEFYDAEGKLFFNSNVGVGITNPAAKMYVAGGGYGSIGGANQSAYAFGAQSIAADASIYSYGAICSGNGWGNCAGGAGVVLGINNSSAAVNIPNSGNSFFNAGNVGIGIASPNFKLDVQGGQINASGGLCIAGICKTAWSQVGGSQWSTSGSNISYEGGNVGIGTTNPGNYRLNVSGPFTGTATYTSYIADGLFGATALPSRISTHNFDGGILFGYEDLGLGDYSPRVGLQQTYDLTASPNITTTKASIGLVRNGNITISGGASNTEFFRIDNSGNVGIGTTSPSTKLELASNSAIKLGNAYFSSGGDYVHLANNEWYNGTSWIANAPGALIQISGQDVNFYRHDAAGFHTQSMSINSSGNVGIGTTPAGLYRLDVQGKINSSELCIATDCKSSWSQVGGGGGPSSFSSITAGTNTVALVVGSGGSLGATGSGTINATTLGGGTFAAPGSIGSTTRGSGAFSAVGINTAAPSSDTLDVNGNTKITGNINVVGTGNITALGTIEGGNIKAKYQDLAEWVPSSEQLAAGTVVVLDTSKSNQVISSGTAYDTRVAGVISAQPGITLGEGGEGKVLVATTGRVKVKVDASQGAIQIGDLLVTSDVSGVAMKSEPVEFAGRKMHMPGTIIGKALEPLARGRGEILVLLSLQ